MSLIELFLQRRPKSSRAYQPQVEMLEQRECPSVAAPTNLTAAAMSSTQVKLTWTDVANASGYNIYHWTGTQSVLAASVAKTASTYQVANLQPNMTQWFQVQAFNATANASSAWVSVVTPPTAISAPLNVKLGNIAQTQMTISWSFVSGATGYTIFQWDGTTANKIGSVGSGANTFAISNLAQGTNYYFYVQAVNATNAANSGWVSGTTLAAGLAAPTNVKATAVSSSAVNLSWSTVSGASGYRVYQSENGQAVLLTSVASSTAGFQVTGLTPGQSYSFFVQAYLGSTTTANSPWVSVTTSGTPLQSITTLTATATGPSTVQLSWTAPAGAVGYEIYIWWGTYWMPWSTIGASSTKVTIGNLTSGLTQWFMVEAFTNNFAETSYSNRAEVIM